MQRVRDAHGLVGNLAEELVRMEADDKDSFWSGSDFFDLSLSFIASIKTFGFEIEKESQGEQLLGAIQQQDAPLMSRFRFEIMSNVKGWLAASARAICSLCSGRSYTLP